MGASSRVVKAVSLWTAVAFVAFAFAWFASEGEPVCEGPLILSGGDSFPPDCDGPAAAIPYFLVGWLVVSIVVGGIALAVQKRQPSSGDSTIPARVE